MPPRKETKTLFNLACSCLSIHTAFCIKQSQSQPHIQQLSLYYGSLPRLVLESLYYWVVQSSFLMTKCELDVDDKDVLKEHTQFMAKALKVVLHPKIRHIDQDFTVDLRNFTNFALAKNTNEESLPALDLQVTEELLTQQPEVLEISSELEKFLSTSEELLTFVPGLFVIDRSECLSSQPHKMSLCFSSPQVVISLVNNCINVTNVSLAGYEDLSDIVLTYISGEHQDSPGLPNLERLVLPSHSYITEQGVKSLLQHLPKLEQLVSPGHMGKVFDMDWQPIFGQTIPLTVFSQIMSITSGGVEYSEDSLDLDEVECWHPSPASVCRIQRLCPNLRGLRLLVEDGDLVELEPLSSINLLEVHVAWAGLTAGLDFYCRRLGDCLQTVDIKLLDNYSWSTIVTIGLHCPSVVKFHLELWREDLISVNSLDLPSDWRERPAFNKLEDLKIKCEDYVEFLPEQVFDFFLRQCVNLQIIQYVAPIDWLYHSDILDVLMDNPLQDLEMLVLENTATGPMQLGLETVHFFLDKCPKLTVLGNLRTWMKIDYYDPESPFHCKCESQFSKLKKQAEHLNWDIDFDAENLNFLYSDMA